MKQGEQPIGPVIFSDMSGGLANEPPPHALGSNQVYDSLDAIFEEHGVTRAPGLEGISDSAIYSGPVRGWFKFVMFDGTITHLAATGKKLYSVDLSDGSLTELYTMQSDNYCSGCQCFGKYWIVNGVDAIKIESDFSVYRIGIAAPLGFSASAVAGGSMSAGSYGLYASYSRQVDGTTVLHSAPLSLGTIVLGGTQKISIDVIESDDPQVDKITFWMTVAGGSVHYYISEVDNATATVEIDSEAVNQDILMLERAAGNQLPQWLKTIYSTSNRLYGTISNSNLVYYSYFAQNVYDLERWPTEYYIPTIPFKAISLFAIDKDLYVNTVGGPYRFVGGDLTVRPEPVIQGSKNNQILYFPENMINTIQEYNNLVYGFTNDGFRYFNGYQFSIDLTKHIKPIAKKIYDGAGTYNPVGIIYTRSGKRTEYQLSYRDDDLSADCNNRTIVLNLDSLVVIDNKNYSAPWEVWGHGYSYASTSSTGDLYVVQFSSFVGTVAKETGVSIINCLRSNGQFTTERVTKELYVRSRMVITELAGLDRWQKMYVLARLNNACTINILITEQSDYRFYASISKTVDNPPVLDGPIPLTLPFILNPNNEINTYFKCSMKSRGNSVAIEIRQNANDDKFMISRLELYGTHERNMMT